MVQNLTSFSSAHPILWVPNSAESPKAKLGQSSFACFQALLQVFHKLHGTAWHGVGGCNRCGSVRYSSKYVKQPAEHHIILYVKVDTRNGHCWKTTEARAGDCHSGGAFIDRVANNLCRVFYNLPCVGAGLLQEDSLQKLAVQIWRSTDCHTNIIAKTIVYRLSVQCRLYIYII